MVITNRWDFCSAQNTIKVTFLHGIGKLSFIRDLGLVNSYPAADLCHHFIKGDIKDFRAVYDFGNGLDAITIKLENVNVDALAKLVNERVKFYPKAIYEDNQEA